MKERWFVKNIKADYKNISKKYGISELITRLMINRNVVEDDMIKNYINPNYSNFHDPYEMKDIEKAAKILKEKIELKEKIRIIGDYDVDGVISVYIIFYHIIFYNISIYH